MEENEVQATPRDVQGKKTRFLRRKGLTPANIYGANMASTAIQIESPVLRKLVSRAGRNVLVTVDIKGENSPYTTFIREVQRHPVTGDLVHVDFYKIDLTQSIRSQIPVVLTGESPAERLSKGTAAQYLMNLEVEALPRDLPREITVDISQLAEINQAIRVADLSLSSAVTILSDPDQLIVRINPLREEEVEEKVEAAAVAEAAPAEEEEKAPEEGEQPQQQA